MFGYVAVPHDDGDRDKGMKDLLLGPLMGPLILVGSSYMETFHRSAPPFA